jgi:hypothetical protein
LLCSRAQRQSPVTLAALRWRCVDWTLPAAEFLHARARGAAASAFLRISSGVRADGGSRTGGGARRGGLRVAAPGRAQRARARGAGKETGRGAGRQAREALPRPPPLGGAGPGRARGGGGGRPGADPERRRVCARPPPRARLLPPRVTRRPSARTSSIRPDRPPAPRPSITPGGAGCGRGRARGAQEPMSPPHTLPREPAGTPPPSPPGRAPEAPGGACSARLRRVHQVRVHPGAGAQRPTGSQAVC